MNVIRPVTGVALLAIAAWLLAPTPPTESPTAEAMPERAASAAHTHDSYQEPVDLSPPSATTDPKSPATWAATQRSIRLHDDADLPAVAAAHDLTIERPVGRSGLALVSGSPEALAALDTDPRVSAAHRVGIMTGASGGVVFQPQWHLDMMGPSPIATSTDWVVAVLDSGVAYETATRRGVAFAEAPSLASSEIFAPYDFVDNDPWANDECGHGTHIASVIASSGVISGTAPGVGLMPVRVLDENNQGTEFALIEGLYHAVDHGADVINLSLSFQPGYVPSSALLDAIDYAAAHDVVMVGASGNHGLRSATWPAASPLVLSVAGTHLMEFAALGWFGDYVSWSSPYANRNASVDVAAPGGNLASDANADGIPDGILAESFHPSNPREVGYWLMAGTSQAAALTSGVVVQLLDAGISPRDIPAALRTQRNIFGIYVGNGAGFLYVDGPPTHYAEAREYHVSVLPFVADEPTRDAPGARMTVFDETGARVGSGYTVFADVVGPGGRMIKCTTDPDGSCQVVMTAGVRKGQPGAWTISVGGLLDPNVEIHRPSSALTATPTVQDLVAAIEDDQELQDAMLAWSWEGGVDDSVGPVSPGLSLVDMGGSGLASLPLGVVMTRSAADQLGSWSSRSLSVADHDASISLLDLDGSGLASLPFGFSRFRILALDGSGLASLPLGLRARDLFGGGPTFVPMTGHGLASLPLGVMESPLVLRLRDGGWSMHGYPAASVLGTSTQLPIHRSYEAKQFGASLGTMPYPKALR